MIVKFKTRIFFIFFIACFAHVAKADNERLARADSLFTEGQYTEAFAYYKSLHDEGLSTDAMLLRMAFIQEGLNDYTKALFYLTTYYQLTADRMVIGKIEKLAEQYELSGYTYSDIDYFAALLYTYQRTIVFVLLLLSVLLIIYLIRKRRSEEKPIGPIVLQLLLMGVVLFVLNYEHNQNGIILNDYTLLRSGPSAGAETILQVDKGHRVPIKARQDVWTKIEWEGSEAFLRSGRIKPI